MDSSFGNAMGLLQALIKKDVPLAQTYTHMILEEQEKKRARNESIFREVERG